MSPQDMNVPSCRFLLQNEFNYIAITPMKTDLIVVKMQCSPFITLCLGFIGMDHVISESCYKGTIFLILFCKIS